ncbi:HNH endonuclease signature motif containing protein [Mycobacterium sp. E740]|uniref:HNH endonuclease signature motif containing protein n=1 Tax=Mycobacterium sp. E740 TaxID=1834149 RepID=UPI0009ED0345|nr:HNH endonuclease signature motif containing protein [Mycobacterium sp. E740]
MFEGVDEAGLVATIEEAARAEASAGALRTAAIGELMSRRGVGDNDDPRALWVCDPWASAAAEVAAAMNISHGRACGQMRIAETLRDRLPKVSALFAAGRISARVIGVLTWRTRLIADEAVWALMDKALAERVDEWGPMSEDNLRTDVDALLLQYDPDAVIASQARARGRDFKVGSYEDEHGATSVWGKLQPADAAVLDRKVAAMVAGVCPDDPRSAGERRSDAAGAIANGNDHLPCACGSPTCPARAAQPAPASSVVVNVYADKAAVDAAQSTPEPVRRTADCRNQGTAVLSGVGGTEVLTTPMLAALLRNGATLRPLAAPVEHPEHGYRPSAKLARRIRARDLRCRFPGCHRRVEFCDIDHVVAHPNGATHQSNLACLCRLHHLLKTFWIGDWSYLLRPDGAAVWTAPTGHTYVTHPGCRTLFPGWDTTAADPAPRGAGPPRGTSPPNDNRGLNMPMRTRPRSVERAQRIKAERAQNSSESPPF